MMRSQVPNTGQPSGSSEQKKSVFDRLGRQLDVGRLMKRRPSPGQYGDYPPPPIHEADFGRYSRDPHVQAEMEWRYQNERRHMPPFSRERHPSSQLPPPHYEMDIGRQPQYYPYPYHPNSQQGPPPNLMGPSGNLSMNMHQQRSSPKYDRHGNVILGFKERGGPMRLGPMDHHHSMSPSRTFMPPGPIMHPGPHEMPSIRPAGMYPSPHRWHDNLEPDFSPHGSRMIQEGRFSPVSSRRYQQQQMLNPQASGHTSGEVPRYTKWRERRDVITTLDRETAQSSSRTDSLKSTLQQPDNRGIVKTGLNSASESIVINKVGQSPSSSFSPIRKPVETAQLVSELKATQSITISDEKDSLNKTSTKPKAILKTEPQDISDGEIVDDEDSSDDSETVKTVRKDGADIISENYLNRSKNLSNPYGRNRESHQYYESSKKRRMLEREDYSMDYETISEDEDLDVFMGDKKISGINSDDTKLGDRLEEEEGKSLSEIELLNALGLDWANLVEMAKQSKTSSKETITGSALPRFSIQNYLPTLGITQDLAGPEIYDLILKVCHS